MVWPCRMVGPIVEEIGQEYDGKARVVKLDVDNNNDTAAKYGIRNIPTLLFLRTEKLLINKLVLYQKCACKQT